jgi:uncharacterized protein YdeI (BOF family)
MKSINTKLALAALAIAMLATPALAQRQHHQVQSQSQPQYTPSNDTPRYPNPVIRSGSQASVDSGAEFDESR